MTNTPPACTCLTTEDASLPHAARCAAFADRDGFTGGALDTTDIRELAELAANSDIDTALSILRAYRARTAR